MKYLKVAAVALAASLTVTPALAQTAPAAPTVPPGVPLIGGMSAGAVAATVVAVVVVGTIVSGGGSGTTTN